MSTNGCILRKTESGASGVYHHWDSNPTSLGKALWATLHGHFKGDLDKMLEFLIDQHPAGWSTICGKDFKLKPGYGDSMKGHPKDHGEGFAAAYAKYLKLPHIARPQCFCHGIRHESAQVITLADKLEWSYVFDSRVELLDVYNNSDLVASLPLNGPEPDWRVIECGADFGRCHHCAYVHFPELKGTASERLGTAAYLGRRPLEFRDADRYRIDGKVYTKGGSGHSSSISHMFPGEHYAADNLWIESVVSKNGRRKNVPVAVVNQGNYEPYPGVEWLFPELAPELAPEVKS